MRFSFISEDKKIIIGALKTGKVYFFNGDITQQQENKIIESPRERQVQENQPPPPVRRNLSLWWILILVLLVGVYAVIKVKRK